MKKQLEQNRGSRTIAACAVLLTIILVAGLDIHPFFFDGISGSRVHAAGKSGVPVFKLDLTWPAVPSKWKLGEVSSIAVNSQDQVWLLQRPLTLSANEASLAAPPVLVFDGAGNFIKSFGGPGKGYEWPQREHGIYIDYKGFVWIGGSYRPARNLPRLAPRTDDQLLKFTQDGRFVMQIGRSNESTGDFDTVNLQQPADTFVYRKTNELFVADGYGNHRVIVFDADTGVFKRMWGAFGNVPKDDYQCVPPILKSVPAGPGPQQFSIVHAIRVSDDGLVYVADRENRRVQIFTIEGKFVKQIVKNEIPFARDLALSPDPDQAFLYVGSGPGITVLDRKTLDVVETIQGGGVLTSSHEMTTDSKGNIYTANTARGLQKLVFLGLSHPSD